MNNAEVVETLRSVVARVLEDASFVFTDECPEGSEPDGAAWDAAGAALAFSGPKSGELRLWADRSFGTLLAANMLGIDISESASAEKGMEAQKEMVNIIVGNLLTEVFGEEAVFTLGIPSVADAARLAADCASGIAVWFLAEESRILCVLEIQE